MFVIFDSSFFSRDIDKRFEFLTRHLLAVDIYLCTGNETQKTHEVLDEPIEREEEYHESGIDGGDRKGDVIQKSNAEDLWGDFSDEEDDSRDAEHRESESELPREVKLLREIECHDRRETRNRDRHRGRSDEVRHQEALIVALDLFEGAGSEPMVLDGTLDDMVRYRHERDFCPGKEDEDEEKYNKNNERHGVHKKENVIKTEGLYDNSQKNQLKKS